jgi:hypothetical protein
MTIDKEQLKEIKITPLIDTLQLEDISDDEYFSERYKDRLSNSRIGLLKTKGAKAFFEGLKSEYNSSFELGTWLHELFLQPESFVLVDDVHNKPTAKAGLVANYLYKGTGITPTDDEIKIASIACNYYKDKLTPNRLADFKQKAEPYWRDRYIYEQAHPKRSNDKERLYVDDKSYTILTKCLESLANDKNIQGVINPTYILEEPINKNEKTILINIQVEIPEHEPVIYKWKSKLDNFIINKEENSISVNDLKTTSRLAVDFDPTYYSYERELAIYSWLLKLCAKKFYELENPTISGNFLVVSTIPEYNTCLYPMTPKLFNKGFKEFTYLLKTVAYLNIVKGYEFK